MINLDLYFIILNQNSKLFYMDFQIVSTSEDYFFLPSRTHFRSNYFTGLYVSFTLSISPLLNLGSKSNAISRVCKANLK